MLLDAAPNREMARARSAMRAKKLHPDSDYFQGRPDTFAASKMRGETSFPLNVCSIYIPIIFTIKVNHSCR